MSAPAESIAPAVLIPAISHRRLVWANLAAIAAIGALFSFHLWPEWRQNPDLSHGFFMPVIFLLLIHDSRRAAAWRPVSDRIAWFATSSLGVFAVLGLGLAGLFATSVGWSHALVDFLLAGAFVALCGAALFAFAAQPRALATLNWPALVAIGLWLLSVPMPPGTYARLTLNLQLWVTGNVLSALHLLGIAANQQGNLIELANATVGIEEACSGVRSLISCVFAGLFFSATMIRRPWARIFLIVLSVPLALGMNFIRSLTLTLLANARVDIGAFWHDATGYGVLGITAAVLAGLALWLSRGEPAPAAPAPLVTARPASRGLLITLVASQTAIALVLLFFAANSQSSSSDKTPPPDLTAILPATYPGWQVLKKPDLYVFRDALQTDHLEERTYLRSTPEGLLQLTVYLAYWSPGQTSVSLVASHTPDACWPGAGWVSLSTGQARLPLPLRTLPQTEYRFFKNSTFPQHVWFWHLYDKQPILRRPSESPRELLRLALTYGFRHAGDQLFVRVSSNRPWADLEHEPLVAEIFSHLQPLGL